uniref:Uncharacterized protein n=1 Tax=Globisporangium ultimum (strain ATCC 200006 / CBS 805.95 / DAOM BR144) TaxID=431595 RepID=K3X2Y5_GLOUD
MPLTSPKSATKTEEEERRRSGNEYSMNQSESRLRNPKKLKVTTQSADGQSEASKQSDKSSPSSSSDVLLMDTFESDGSSRSRDFWNLHCALCCSGCEAVSSSDALFLCPSCDQKYPTQRALGRV